MIFGKNKTILILAVGLFFLMFSGSKCKKMSLIERFYSIEIINNSENSISTFFADKHSTSQYPDTILPMDRQSLVVTPPTRKYYHYSRDLWSEEFEYLKNDTLSIYILNAETYQNSSWIDIRNEYLILKRYDLSYKDLESLNFKVFYPPNENMRYMKMWPPYGER